VRLHDGSMQVATHFASRVSSRSRCSYASKGVSAWSPGSVSNGCASSSAAGGGAGSSAPAAPAAGVGGVGGAAGASTCCLDSSAVWGGSSADDRCADIAAPLLRVLYRLRLLAALLLVPAALLLQLLNWLSDRRTVIYYQWLSDKADERGVWRAETHTRMISRGFRSFIRDDARVCV